MPLMAALLRRKIPIRNPNPNRLIGRRSSSSPETTPIEKILVANRGEIACRIMRTARRLGIRTVAVYSDADRNALHVKSADEAVRIGPPPARSSYLNASAIVEAALRTGAQAIHPGYGFLSETADFAKRCEDEGLSFIGPPASAIRDMGDKSASKRIMGAAGVPLVPGYHGDNQDIEFLKLEAEKIGYPILIKPTHGGGGKGMRIVEGPGEFAEAFLGAQREAAASFGISTVLLEKYITQPRHIEVQVFGDKHGNVIHLNERDCSVQRRHQKIIEEAPAPNITEDLRAQLGGSAVSAAKAVGYYNAGTVEFIMDTDTDKFYFMEMNTRLQVEHPVTEMIVGQDLVEWQIRIANGEHLPLSQENVPINGHAFEARIYAENVSRGFLPATGKLHHYYPVKDSASVRVETGVEEGDDVSVHYDPMIAKLVVWGKDRRTALVKLKNCLLDFQVAGLPTNINFLYMLSDHYAFEQGLVETHFIEHFKSDLFPDEVPAKSQAAAKVSATLVAACICHNERITSKENLTGGDKLLSVWYTNPAFRMHHAASHVMELECDKELNGTFQDLLKIAITYRPDGGYFVKFEEEDSPGMVIQIMHVADRQYRVDIGGLQFTVTLASYLKDNSKYIHVWHGNYHHIFRQTMRLQKLNDDAVKLNTGYESVCHPEGSVLAPMAGLVVKVLVQNGASVDEGQPILVLEAMKMEHVVKSPRGGYVDGLQVVAGQQVFDSTVLFTVKGK